MQAKLSVVALSVAAAFTLSACGNKEEPKPAPAPAAAAPAAPVAPPPKPEITVKLGHVAPMTGPQAHLGKDNENGARLAIDELNEAGVEIGGKKVKLELVSEDDQADAKTATTVAQRLIDGTRTRLVVGMNLPMVLRAISYRAEPLDTLVMRALTGASQAVMQVLPSDGAPSAN